MIVSHPLANAVSKGLVRFWVYGAGREVTSRIIVQLVSTTGATINLIIPRGTQFVPAMAGFQTMVTTSDVSVEVPTGVAEGVEVTVPTLCGSSFTDQPPLPGGEVNYAISSDPSPISDLMNEVGNLGDSMYGPLADSIGMPHDMFQDAICQYANWAIHHSPAKIWFPPVMLPSHEQDKDEAPEDATVRFDAPKIAELLGPELSQHGASKDEIGQIATVLWQGVDATVHSLAQHNPQAIFDMANTTRDWPRQDGAVNQATVIATRN